MSRLPGQEARSGRGGRFPFRLVLFGAAGLVAFAYGFLAHPAAEAGLLLQRHGYLVMLGTFLWWGFAMCRLAADSDMRRAAAGWRDWLQLHRAAIGSMAGLTLVACLTVPFSYKVLFDELVLQSTAWNLHFFRELGTMLRGYEVEGVFRSLFVYVDKRPFFYPFIVSLVHDLTGFRLTNAFLVNSVLLPVCLLLLYGVLKQLAGFRAALAGLVCFGASSLLAQSANGSGMEMLNLVMLLLTLRLAVHYLAGPEERRLSALVLSCVLLAQTRYESALYVAPVALVILEGWRRAGRLIMPPAALAAPLLLIPCALHNTYLSGTPMLWELHENTASRFSPEYLWGNLASAARYFFDFSRQLLSSWWLSLAGFPALLVVAASLWSKRREWRTAAPVRLAAVLFGGAAAGNLGLLLFYYWGQLDDHIVARLVLPFNAVLAMAVAWTADRLPPDWPPVVTRGLIVGALVSYLGFGLPTLAYHRTLNQRAWEMSWEQQWVANRPVVPRLIITNKSALSWLIMKTPSIDIGRARHFAERVRFHLEAGTFQEVLVTQYYRPTGPEGGFILDPQDALPSAYVLAPLVERQIGGKLLRISRLVEIGLPQAKEEGNPGK
jgi:hypothetical protein